VVRLIEILSEGKCINENNIPTIKLSKFVLAPVLTHIFNKRINEGFYPDLSKSGRSYTYLQIWRTKNLLKISTYSISIFLQFNKIFEGILYDRVHFYLQEYKLLSKSQFVSGLNLQLHMQLRALTSIV